MKLDRETITILLDAYALTAQASADWYRSKAAAIDHNAIVQIEADPDVGSAWQQLVDVGFAYVDDNDDPMNRDVYPFVGQLSDLGVAWCCSFAHSYALSKVPVSGSRTTMLTDMFAEACAAQIEAREKGKLDVSRG